MDSGLYSLVVILTVLTKLSGAQKRLLQDSCEVIEVRNRVGFNEEINGQYFITDEEEGGRPYFFDGNEIYIYFLIGLDLWVIGEELGLTTVFAYGEGNVETPDLVTGVWQIWSTTLWIPDGEMIVECAEGSEQEETPSITQSTTEPPTETPTEGPESPIDSPAIVHSEPTSTQANTPTSTPDISVPTEQSPTSAPTEQLEPVSTVFSTIQETGFPTELQTERPTEATEMPIDTPTDRPTHMPTDRPTDKQTDRPAPKTNAPTGRSTPVPVIRRSTPSPDAPEDEGSTQEPEEQASPPDEETIPPPPTQEEETILPPPIPPPPTQEEETIPPPPRPPPTQEEETIPPPSTPEEETIPLPPEEEPPSPPPTVPVPPIAIVSPIDTPSPPPEPPPPSSVVTASPVPASATPSPAEQSPAEPSPAEPSPPEPSPSTSIRYTPNNCASLFGEGSSILKDDVGALVDMYVDRSEDLVEMEILYDPDELSSKVWSCQIMFSAQIMFILGEECEGYHRLHPNDAIEVDWGDALDIITNDDAFVGIYTFDAPHGEIVIDMICDDTSLQDTGVDTFPSSPPPPPPSTPPSPPGPPEPTSGPRTKHPRTTASPESSTKSPTIKRRIREKEPLRDVDETVAVAEQDSQDTEYSDGDQTITFGDGVGNISISDENVTDVQSSNSSEHSVGFGEISEPASVNFENTEKPNNNTDSTVTGQIVTFPLGGHVGDGAVESSSAESKPVESGFVDSVSVEHVLVESDTPDADSVESQDSGGLEVEETIPGLIENVENYEGPIDFGVGNVFGERTGNSEGDENAGPQAGQLPHVAELQPDPIDLAPSG